MRKDSIFFNRMRPAAKSEIMRDNAGFSLIELMIVIAIVGILSAMTVPAFLSWRGNSQLRSAVTTLKGDLESAKMRAIRDNTTVTVTLNADGSYTASIGGTSFINRNPVGAAIAFINGLISPFTFGSDGRPSSTGDITITGGSGKVVTININMLGRINIQ